MSEYKIRVPKKIYLKVKAYSLQSGLKMAIVTKILVDGGINIYDQEASFAAIARYKRVRKIK